MHEKRLHRVSVVHATVVYRARFVQKEHLTKERKALIDGLLPTSLGFYITEKIAHQSGNFFPEKKHRYLIL